MNRFWRGIAIFVLGAVLGTGFGVTLEFFISSGANASAFSFRQPI